MISSLSCRNSGQWYLIWCGCVLLILLGLPFCNFEVASFWVSLMNMLYVGYNTACERPCGFEYLWDYSVAYSSPSSFWKLVCFYYCYYLREFWLYQERFLDVLAMSHDKQCFCFYLMVESSQWTKGFPQLVSPIMFYLLIIKVNPSSLKKSTHQIIMSSESYGYIVTYIEI